MFGTIMANKPELKVREFERYKGFYCGLCRQLRDNSGRLSQLTLTYDMTFLILLLSSLYEPGEQEERHRCFVHPGRKQRMIRNEITDYAADMNVLLSYYHFLDDWADEKKVSAKCASWVFAGTAKRIAERYPRQAEVIQAQLSELGALEKQGVTQLDDISRPFGTLLSELFVYREDSFQDILRRFGFFLGKYIYLLDACLDLEQDQKKEAFNPLLERSREPSFEKSIKEVLDSTMREAIIEFEKLPLEMDLPILRNILYEGAKLPLLKKWQDKKLEEKEHDE